MRFLVENERIPNKYITSVDPIKWEKYDVVYVSYQQRQTVVNRVIKHCPSKYFLTLNRLTNKIRVTKDV